MSSSPHRSTSRGRTRTPTRAIDDTNMDTTTGHPNGTRDRTKSVEDFRSRSRSRTPRVRSRSRTYTRSPNHSRSPSPPALPKSAKIVIEKLTKNVHEAHLREIFSTYGTITELEMPMNPQFMMNKGIAYILFTQPSHAESAIAHMHEAQLDGALVNVSIVLPRRRFSRSPPMKRPALDRFGEPHRLRQTKVAESQSAAEGWPEKESELRQPEQESEAGQQIASAAEEGGQSAEGRWAETEPEL
ncbi:hypothetical protein B0A54_00247 [Friedmanniomyces endolithicus]|uniref:RRM domain-containing protein n=1 Tax=Friedmanniomyces endolithicus TaxID=329885 RepID=A0A4U0VJV7_9PEZI|nr:hypothetical protein B0A54_00247 [Friedmanniomyces endolithicus]